MFDVGCSWLFLDASGVATRAGVWQSARWLGWRESDAPALESVFANARAALAESCVPLEKIGGYLYVEGPGSVLGLRVAAMAIRTWQTDDAARNAGPVKPVLSCGTLSLAAALALAGGVPPPFAVFTEARQGHWHLLQINDRTTTPILREVGENGLPAGALYHLPARKAWHKPPPHAQPLPVSLRDHPEILAQPNLFHPVETPVPFTGHPPEYKKWGAQKT